MRSRRNVLAVCSFFPEDTLVEETVRTFGAGSDLYLVSIEPEKPAPPAALPFLAERKLGLDAAAFLPCKKWRSVDLVLPATTPSGPAIPPVVCNANPHNLQLLAESAVAVPPRSYRR